MPTSETPSSSASPSPTTTDDSLEQLARSINQAGALLPITGPITNFVFLNTLQAMEDLPFHEGLKQGAALFRCQPYLSEERYREKLQRGRIHAEDLAWVLNEELQHTGEELVCPLTTRLQLRQAMLEYPLLLGPTMELRWYVAQTDALKRMRREVTRATRERFHDETRRWVLRDLQDGVPQPTAKSDAGKTSSRSAKIVSDLLKGHSVRTIENWPPEKWESVSLQALWRACRQGIHGIDLPKETSVPLVRHRDLLLQATGIDSDLLVHDILIRYCAAYLDQGQANWILPDRERGFFGAFLELYGQASRGPEAWSKRLPKELQRLKSAGISPLESVAESLQALEIPREEWNAYVTESVLALRGWTAMIRHMEDRPDRFPFPTQSGTMIEYLAVRLILERLALVEAAGDNHPGTLSLTTWRTRFENTTPGLQLTGDHWAFLFFQLAQVLGWTPPDVLQFTKQDWTALIREFHTFSEIDRRRTFHLAFERRFRRPILDSMSVVAKRSTSRVSSPAFQAVFCIDAREESFRRHLEEVHPQVETFGAAGFFSIPIYYKGVADAHFTALCPIVLRPQHWLTEEVIYTFSAEHERRAKTRKALGTATHQLHMRSRGFAGGAILTAGLGVLASIPLVARVLFPRFTARFRKAVGRFVEAPRLTRLRIERSTPQPGPEPEANGFTPEEMANFGERLLRDIGLTSGFSRLVIFMGHGSFCLNNPHKSAYDCGACSGGAGGPNARALAMMLNDLRVREMLYRRGLEIPRDTVFAGALHNTCVDSISFYDLDLLPSSHRHDLDAARDILDETCLRNAHERCRRFYSAPLNLSTAAAKVHVEGRSEDLAQTRPEFGNATNALCYVGRRQRVRGLFMDRRAFMHSYDARQDDSQQTILTRILGAVVPVCEGINLTYYFSYVDPTGWGAGTKLPHNVTSLLGVMDGPCSDLRIGLPLQGVEIHEPIRLLFVIETSPEEMLQIMDRNPLVGKIIRNGWVQLSVLDPDSSRIQVFLNGAFRDYHPGVEQLPRADSSQDWYRGWREHLGFCLIER